MDSKDLAHYMETNDGLAQPWLWVQMRLRKLEEQKADISGEEYAQRLMDIHQDLMNLGEWWVGREQELFGEG